jgi:hypothetical protein
LSKKLYPKPDEVLRAAVDCHEVLAQKTLDHIVTGGLAVFLHSNGFNKPRDVDLLVRDENTGALVVGTLLLRFRARKREYRWDDFRGAVLHRNGVRIDVHWDGKGNRHLPYPSSDQIVELRSLPVLSLYALIESKLESVEGEKSKHREHVLALIRANQLEQSTAENLQPEYRQMYLALVDEVLSGQ